MSDWNYGMRSAACALSLVFASSAPLLAQADPESGDFAAPAAPVGAQGGGRAAFGGQVQGGMVAQAQAQPQPGQTWQPPTQQIEPMPGSLAPLPPDAQPEDGAAESAAPGDSDHAGVVGDLGVGFFGVQMVPIMSCDLSMPLCAALGDTGVSAPTIGARYWLSESLGIEAALGLNVSSGTIGPIETSTIAFAVHGGVPLALAHAGHFVFEVVPQINFGYANGSFETGGAAPLVSDTSGLLFEVGAKVGAEIHFGFIDIPQLSLQGTLGLMLRSESRDVETQAIATLPVAAEQSQLTLSTGVDGEPWDVFTGAITAIYYLDLD